MVSFNLQGRLRCKLVYLRQATRCCSDGVPGQRVPLGLVSALRMQNSKKLTFVGTPKPVLARHRGGHGPDLARAASMAPLSTGSPWMEIGAIVLGYVVVFGACFRNVPQITRVVKHRSAKGISVTSLLVDTATITITAAYNFCKGVAAVAGALCTVDSQPHRRELLEMAA
ncbi:unnamed protein product [Ostreobium quekettii]|uniref:Uncharacterized protein n=1 Tax=Ostreobium quekettii TaxID=121088 RepID=A0A8S1J8M4_9CHLO|nr:unnamed protein product [Ostreobium quekettii]